MYQHEVAIPFYWGDSAGVMYFGHSFSIAHQVYERFVIENLHYTWEDWFQNREWAIPVKHTEANFQNPLLPGKSCLVKMTIEEVKTSSFTSSYHFFQEGLECCTVKIVHVFCSKKNQQKQPIPATIKSLLQAQ
jgi:acyl-CoA thioesterase FadM